MDPQHPTPHELRDLILSYLRRELELPAEPATYRETGVPGIQVHCQDGSTILVIVGEATKER